MFECLLAKEKLAGHSETKHFTCCEKYSSARCGRELRWRLRESEWPRRHRLQGWNLGPCCELLSWMALVETFLFCRTWCIYILGLIFNAITKTGEFPQWDVWGESVQEAGFLGSFVREWAQETLRINTARMILKNGLNHHHIFRTISYSD